MRIETNLAAIPIEDALARVNELLTPVFLSQERGNVDKVVVELKYWAECKVTLWKNKTGIMGKASVLDVIEVNNILAVTGRPVEFKPISGAAR